MIRSLYTSATGMQAQTMNIDVIANNLANVNTSGFKKSRADFQDLLYDTLQAPGAASSAGTQVPTGLQVGHGVRTVAVSKVFSAGEYQATKNELDMALTGDGFFQILRPDGSTGYSRAGSFKLDSDGRIVTPDGFPIEPEMTIPADSINVTIGVDGKRDDLDLGDHHVLNGKLRQIGKARLRRPATRGLCLIFRLLWFRPRKDVDQTPKEAPVTLILVLRAPRRRRGTLVFAHQSFPVFMTCRSHMGPLCPEVQVS